MGSNRQIVAVEPSPDTDLERITAQLTEWDLETETTAVINGWVTVVGFGYLSREAIQAFFADIDIATSVTTVLVVTYLDGAASYLGYCYESDGTSVTMTDSLTEREYRRAEVFDYFKREHGINAGF